MDVIVNRNISIKAFVIITIFAILIGLAMIYIATKGFININILKNYKKEIAKINYSMIVDTAHSGSEHSTYQRKVKYIYFVDNQQYEGQDILWWRFLFNSDRNVQVGDEIEIFYNINNPSQSEIYHISYVLIVVGICFIVVPILVLRQRIKEN